jgi:hypothetical protein
MQVTFTAPDRLTFDAAILLAEENLLRSRKHAGWRGFDLTATLSENG